MGNVNRKATRDEMAHAESCAIREAFPDLEPVFGGHSRLMGPPGARATTPSPFGFGTRRASIRSNVVWIVPEHLGSLTPGDIHNLVARANGERPKRRSEAPGR